MSARRTNNQKESFWVTLPGIITAITGLVVAITGLITVLGDEGVLTRLLGTDGDREPAPTAFPTVTSVDEDVILPSLLPATPVPTSADPVVPACTDFLFYEGKSNPNAILLAYTGTEFWVRYADLEEGIASESGVAVYIFDSSESAGDCLRAWVKYLAAGHRANWPLAESGNGRAIHQVWLNSSYPPRVGELAGWTVLPDLILIAAVDEMLSPDFVQVYECGQDIPREILGLVAFWHAATSEQALQGYLDLYEGNGYLILEPVPCQE